MQSIIRTINSISQWSGRILFLAPWVITAIIVYEIVLRDVFNRPTIWAHETSVMVFGAFIILAGAYVLRHRSHVNMDLIYGGLSARGKAILDIVSFPLFFIFCGILLWKGAHFAWRSIEIWETSSSVWGPPLWPIKVVIPLGAFLILLQGVGKFISDLFTAVTNKEVD